MNQPASILQPTDNRVLDAALFYVEQEAVHRVKNPMVTNDDAAALRHLKTQYERIIMGFNDGRRLSPDERKTLDFLKYKVRQMNARLQPNWLQNIVNARPVRLLVNKVLRRSENIAHHEKLMFTYGTEKAMVQNIDHIHASMRKVGFTGQIEQALKKMIDNNLPAFSIRHVQPDALQADFILHFAKYTGTDVYYFTQYDAISRSNRNSISLSPHQEVVFTAPEAAHLANGRAVQKNVQGTSLWYTADPSQPAGLVAQSFDLERALSEWKLKETANTTSAKKLLAALEGGEQAQVTLNLPGGRTETLLVKVSATTQQLTFTTLQGQYVDPHHLTEQQEKALQISKQLGEQQSRKKQRAVKAQ